MQLLSMQTGNPSYDSVVSWLTNGGSLQSPGAIFALGSLIKLVLVPLLASLFRRFKIEFSGPNKLHAVFAVSILTVVAFNFVGRSGISFGDCVTMGIQIGLVAIGIHEASSTLSTASQVKADMDQVKAALSGPEVEERS